MSWAPGTIVVCVDARPAPGGVFIPPLELGAYYTIRDIYPAVGAFDEIGVRCQEFVTDCSVQLRLGRVPEYGLSACDYPCRQSRFRLAESPHSESTTARTKEPARA